MAQYHGPVCRICRREGEKLFFKGDRCLTDKCSVEKRSYPPGQHTVSRVKLSDYGLQLREKQKVKKLYGLLEKQFRIYVDKAVSRPGVSGENLLQSLERRFDNVVYRMGFAASRHEARHLVLHRHFLINNKTVDIPSFQVKPGDVVTLSQRGSKVGRIKICTESAQQKEIPAWLSVDFPKIEGKVIENPSRDVVTIPIKEQLIIELYSR